MTYQIANWAHTTKAMLLWFIAWLSIAQAVDPAKPEDPPLAKDFHRELEKPRHVKSPPPVHPPPEALHGFGCERKFNCNQDVFYADSKHRQDGEMLRSFMQPYPAALAELDAYQATRRSIRTASYFGTAGLLIIIGGLIASSQLTGVDQVLVRNTFTAIGAGTILGTAAVTLTILHINENRLHNAVGIYNQNNPDKQIVLQFKSQLEL